MSYRTSLCSCDKLHLFDSLEKLTFLATGKTIKPTTKCCWFYCSRGGRDSNPQPLACTASTAFAEGWTISLPYYKRNVGTPVSSLYGALNLFFCLTEVPSVFAYLDSCHFEQSTSINVASTDIPESFTPAFAGRAARLQASALTKLSYRRVFFTNLSNTDFFRFRYSLWSALYMIS